MLLEQAREIAEALLRQYQLTYKGWNYGYNNNKRRLGVCKYHEKRIELCRYYTLNNPDSCVIDTIRHEIAHALVGPGNHHNGIWQSKAIELGASPKPCKTIVAHVPVKWIAICPECKRQYGQHRRPLLTRRYFCRDCRVSVVWQTGE